MRQTRTLAVAVSLLLVLAACASQPALPVRLGEVPGFFRGLWHGLIAPIAFVGSLFSDVEMYAWPNSGGWYDFGFLLGIGAWGGGAAAAK
jgi:hypothetical protein